MRDPFLQPGGDPFYGNQPEDTPAPAGLLTQPAFKPQRDSALGYSVDQAQRLMGRGTQVIGELTGIDTVADFGRDVVAAQDEDIREGGYRPNYTGSFLETLDAEGVGGALGWIGEKSAENWATTGGTLLGGLAAVATAPFSVPAALTLTGATMGGSYLLSTGEAASEMDEQGLPTNNALAAGAGALIALLDRFGVTKVIPKSKLLSISGRELVESLEARGLTDAANATREALQKAGDGAKQSLARRMAEGAANESVTESVQEGVSIATAASQGAEYTGEDVLNRLVDAGVVAAPMGGVAASVPGTQVQPTEEQKALQITALRERKRRLMTRGRVRQAKELDAEIEALGGSTREYQLTPEELGVQPTRPTAPQEPTAAEDVFEDTDIEYDPFLDDTGRQTGDTATFDMPSTPTPVTPPQGGVNSTEGYVIEDDPPEFIDLSRREKEARERVRRATTAWRELNDTDPKAANDDSNPIVQELDKAREGVKELARESERLAQDAAAGRLPSQRGRVISEDILDDDPAAQLEREQAEAERMTRGGIDPFLTPQPTPETDIDRFERVEEFAPEDVSPVADEPLPTSEAPAMPESAADPVQDLAQRYRQAANRREVIKAYISMGQDPTGVGFEQMFDDQQASATEADNIAAEYEQLTGKPAAEWREQQENWLSESINVQANPESLAETKRLLGDGQPGSKGDPRFMVAWHGSPYKFDRFSTSAIGTGEGAQAYGHGLYFAENPDVAGRYSQLPNGVEISRIDAEMEALDAEAGPLRGARFREQSVDEELLGARRLNEIDKRMRELVVERKSLIDGGSGHLYEVDIPDATIDKMLDWDSKLTSPTMDSVVRRFVREHPDGMVAEAFNEGGIREFGNGGDLYRSMSQDLMPTLPPDSPSAPRGWQFVQRGNEGDRYASQWLAKNGVPGIRYFDGQSRDSGDGTRNFVVFDENDVSMLSRNGETRFNASRPYQNAPDSLMGFKGDGKEQTPYEEQKYRYEQPVRVTLEDGQVFEDAIKGLNRAHAIERAYRNWPTATNVEPIVPAENPAFNADAEPAPGPKTKAFQIVDRQTGTVVGTYNVGNQNERTVQRRARTRLDKLDNEYGGYRYQMKRVYEDGAERPAFNADVEPAPAAYTAETLTAELQPLIDELTTAKINVVENEADLPAEVQARIAERNFTGRVQGVYHDGQTYVVASNVQTLEQAVRTVLEETIGHLGIRRTFGDRLNNVLLQVYRGIPEQTRNQLAERYGVSLETQEGRLEVADEFIGKMAQEGIEPTKLQRVVAAVRQWLRDMGYDLQWTDNDIISLLEKNRENMRDPEGAGTVNTGESRFMVAWHGSPHKFDKFSTENIGTGEGAQAYGYGLYFAENKGVAGGYRDIGTAGLAPRQIARKMYQESDELREAWPLSERAFVSWYTDPDVDPASTNLSGVLERAKANLEGNLYEVDIPDEAIDKMLDWDKPLGEQPEAMAALQAAAERIGRPQLARSLREDETGGAAYIGLTGAVGDGKLMRMGYPSGQSGQSRVVSEALRDVGIPGIKYLDGDSRRAGEGTRNFVVFDESTVKVLSRNGEPMESDTRFNVTPEVPLTPAQAEAVDWALGMTEEVWADADSDGPVNNFTEDEVPESWTLPKIVDGKLRLSDWGPVNDDMLLRLEDDYPDVARDAVSRREITRQKMNAILSSVDGLISEVRRLTRSDGNKKSDPSVRFNVTPDIRLSATDAQSIDNNPESPKSRLAKLEAINEALQNDKRSPVDILSDLWKNKYSGFLGTIPRRYLVDFAEKSMTAVRAYIRTAQRMDAQHNKLRSEHAGVADEWRKLSKDDQRNLADTMHEATINAVDPDPDTPFDPLTYTLPNGDVIDLSDRAAAKAARDKLERAAMRDARSKTKSSTEAFNRLQALTRLTALQKRRERVRPRMRSMWNALTPEAQDVYRKARDAYKLQHKRTLEALEKRIEAATDDKDVSSGFLQELRKEFESRTVEGPYFPLARFGDHWAMVKDENGEILEYQMFENPSEQDAYLKAVSQLDGVEVFHGTAADMRDAIKEVDPGFAARVTEMAKRAGGSQGKALADDIWQLYLRTLPEMSARKSSLHRNKYRGYSRDALRAFTSSMFHGATQLARLQYQWQLEGHLERLRKQSGKADDKNKAKRLYEELVKRHEWSMSPFASPLATKLTSLGFVWYLGLTPAAALVNMTQTPMIAGPILAAKHGWGRTTKELAKASREFAGVAGQNVVRRLKGKKIFLDHADKKSMAEILSGDELRAFEHAVEAGTFDKTQSHDLAGIADAGENYNGWQYRVMERVAAMFHNAEVYNREVTYMAAYRLARQDGNNHAAAVEHADNMVWDAHFDYGSTNRPRFMQNDFAKVAFLFKQHSMNMTYRLGRDFNEMIRGASPAVRREARTRFVGILSTTFFMAGMTGMPLWSAVNFVLSSIIGDDDEPFDLETEMRVALAEQFGTDVADIIMKGSADKLTGATISSRVSLNNLWFRDPETRKEGQDLARHYMAEALGPVYKAIENGVVGAGNVLDGSVYRGTEKMVPKAVKDVMKMARYAAEGATTQRGDTVQDDFTGPQLLYQLLGFTPAELAMRYEQNNALKNYESKILYRRARLLNNYALGLRFGDTERVRQAMEDIQAFNRKNRSIAITDKVIQRSLRSRQRYTEEAINGITLNKNLRYLTDELDFTE